MTTLCHTANSLTVLFVDDDGTSRMIGCHLLKDHPAKVVTAVNGQDALEKIKKQHFDIVFTDLNMPIMDGLELKKILAKKRPEIPVVSMSGSYTDSHIQEYLELGFKELLSKPLQKNQIYDAINQFCSVQVVL